MARSLTATAMAVEGLASTPLACLSPLSSRPPQASANPRHLRSLRMIAVAAPYPFGGPFAFDSVTIYAFT